VKNLNKIIKEKVVLKFKLDSLNELGTIDFEKLINDKDIFDKSIEVTYENKNKILIIDYIKKLYSVKND